MGNNLDVSTVLSFNFFLFLFLNEKKKCVFFVTFFAQAKKVNNKIRKLNINLSYVFLQNKGFKYKNHGKFQCVKSINFLDKTDIIMYNILYIIVF